MSDYEPSRHLQLSKQLQKSLGCDPVPCLPTDAEIDERNTRYSGAGGARCGPASYRPGRWRILVASVGASYSLGVGQRAEAQRGALQTMSKSLPDYQKHHNATCMQLQLSMHYRLAGPSKLGCMLGQDRSKLELVQTFERTSASVRKQLLWLCSKGP